MNIDGYVLRCHSQEGLKEALALCHGNPVGKFARIDIGGIGESLCVIGQPTTQLDYSNEGVLMRLWSDAVWVLEGSPSVGEGRSYLWLGASLVPDSLDELSETSQSELSE